MKIKRYLCGHGEGMFETEDGDWIEYDEYCKKNAINTLFIGRVAEIIGFEKTTKILKACQQAIQSHYNTNTP
jgi:hypothetical protein